MKLSIYSSRSVALCFDRRRHQHVRHRNGIQKPSWGIPRHRSKRRSHHHKEQERTFQIESLWRSLIYRYRIFVWNPSKRHKRKENPRGQTTRISRRLSITLRDGSSHLRSSNRLHGRSHNDRDRNRSHHGDARGSNRSHASAW